MSKNNSLNDRFGVKAATGPAPASLSASVDGDSLVIRVPLMPAGTRSKSGKSILIASTNGNKTVRVGDANVKLGVNCYLEG